jgi:hypothetical protein
MDHVRLLLNGKEVESANVSAKTKLAVELTVLTLQLNQRQSL